MPEIFTAPWYPWYADDILLSERVELMNLAEEGAYRRALDRAWIKGSVPADPKMCARTIGKGCSTKIAEVVLTMFRPSPDDPTRMINDTLEKIREQQKHKYETQAAKGRKGGSVKKPDSSPAKAQLNHSQSHSDSDSDSEDLRPSPEPERTQPTRPRSLPNSVELEITVWLDAIAPLTGATNRARMANAKRWREAVEIAMKDGHELTNFLAVIKSEVQRNKATPQFFTPEGSLKVLQLGQVKTNNGFHH